jgi:hypothetical protein
VVGVVVGGSVGTVEELGGTKIEDVGGGRLVVGSGGGSVVAVVVSTGGGLVAGGLVAGGLVPVLRGAVVITGGDVVPEVPDGAGAAVVEVPRDVDVEEVDVDDVDGPLDVVVGRCVVVVTALVEGDWVATCCLGDVSLPVATSKRRAARAMVARAYSPTLKR